MRTAGVLHIVAVSGMHMFVLVAFLELLLGKSRRTNLIALPLIWLFALTAGWRASVVRAAEEPAQHIAPALVGGQHAVAYHHGGRPDVVGDDPQGHVHLVGAAIGGAGDLGHFVGDVHHRVHVEEAVHVLAHHGQTLQAHAGVYVLLLQLRVAVMAVVVELGEDHVPDLHVPVAVAAHGAGGLAAAVLGAAVVVDLGAGAAGAGAVLPEVVLLAELIDALGGDAHHVPPDGEGLVVSGGGLVAGEHGRVEPVRVKAHPVGAGQKLPCPGDGLFFEVIAEGEVAQHLEVGAVTGGLADVLDVAGADALLAGAHPVTGRLLFPGEVGLHGGHAGVDEQQAGVVLGDQGEAGQTQVALGLKEGQEHLPQFVDAEFLFHFCCTSLWWIDDISRDARWRKPAAPRERRRRS